jgi:hypothetical protein
MDPSDLQITHIPGGPARAPTGFSPWRLARIDNQPCRFPSNLDLIRLFRESAGEELRIEETFRGAVCRLLYIPTGVPKEARERFIVAIAPDIHVCPELVG